ncbi:MAG: flagellar assembly protein FliX [Caulobacteraceae bacterium]
MKVTGPTYTSGVTPRSNSPTPANGFSIGEAEGSAAASPARAGSLGAVSTLDALLTLQEVLGPLERKRRAVRRASEILNALEGLRLNLLEDGPSSIRDVLTQLQRSVRETRDHTDDPALESVLEEVELRAAVELAKREVPTP